MKYILGAVIAILCSFTCTDTLYGKSPATDVDDILIINTYTEANPWSNDFITSIVNMASQNSHNNPLFPKTQKLLKPPGYKQTIL